MRLVCLFSLIAATSFAHGITAQTLSVQQSPWSANGLWVGTTFGLLLTDDRCTWRWVCVDHLGFGEREVPSWFVSPTGSRVFAASLSGVVVSTDRGCSFSRVAFFDSTGASSILSSSTDLFVTTARFGAENGLARSRDDGASFEWTGLRLRERFFSGVRVAPSKPARVYVSAWYFEPKVTSLHVSDDAAATFTTIDVPQAIGAHLAVHAVDPQNADVVFVSSTDDTNVPATSALLRSDDAGRSFRAVLTAEGSVTGLVHDQGVWWLTVGDRLYRSAEGVRFELEPHPKQRACVGRVGGETLVCGRVAGDDGYALARVENGQATPLLQWPQLAGPIDCPAASPTAMACSVTWPVERAELGLPLDHVASCSGRPEPMPEPEPEPEPVRRACAATSGLELIIAVVFFLRARARVDFARAR